MSLKLKNIILIATYLLLFSNCKKQYPDDSKLFNLKSPKKRLVGGWIIDQIEPNYWGLKTVGEGKADIHFNSSGICTGLGYGNNLWDPTYVFLYDFNGKWELINNDDKLKITYNKLPSYSRIFTIKRLEKVFFTRYLTITSDSVSYSFYNKH